MTTPTLYSIKPLAWELVRAEDNYWIVQTIFGSISVDQDEGGSCRWRYCFDEYYDEDSHECESIEDGKAAAEAFYLERIMPALQARA